MCEADAQAAITDLYEEVERLATHNSRLVKRVEEADASIDRLSRVILDLNEERNSEETLADELAEALRGVMDDEPNARQAFATLAKHQEARR